MLIVNAGVGEYMYCDDQYNESFIKDEILKENPHAKYMEVSVTYLYNINEFKSALIENCFKHGQAEEEATKKGNKKNCTVQ